MTRGRFVDLEPFQPPGGPSRPVRAYVPAGPEDAARPLLVLFDGQNVYGDEGSFAGGWYAHDAVDRLTGRTARAPIVVAVENGGHRRVREMGVRARDFAHAVARELLPLVAGRFPLDGPEHRAVGGASLGGLAALHAWFDHPDAFGAAMAMSPSLWFAEGELLREIEAGRPVPGGRLYVDAGARERGRMFADAERLAAVLAPLVADLRWRPDRRGTHHERHWRRRLPGALRFLFRQRG